MSVERIQKIIAKSGYCSRRKAEDLIDEGKVTVNNIVVSLGDKADVLTDKIMVGGKPISLEQKEYFMVHKPKGYITTARDEYDRKIVVDLVDTEKRVYPVGRLDRDATGLILLTNDGDFSQNIIHPRNEVQKTYVAILTEPFNKDDIGKLLSGVRIDKTWVKADQVVVLDRSTVALSVHVGINKVVKRLFKEIGYYVKHLHRTHIGSLALDIPSGGYRVLTEEDKTAIFTPLTLCKKTFE
ncbi:MAG: pseudouridine synthase [Nanobdellota archaeon]